MKTFLKRFGIAVLIIGMIIVFLLIATSGSDLQVYDSEGGTSTYTVTTEAPDTFESEQLKDPTYYQNNEINFSMQIPADWEYVLKDGYDTYVHSASASSIQIQVLSYYPMVNDMTYDLMYETYAESGYTLTEFSYMANNAYYDIYQAYVNSGVYDTIEEVIWDRQHVVKVIVTFDDANYEKLQDDIWASIDSVVWDYEDPIDSDLYLSYQTVGDFEFAVPMDWYVGTTDESYYAYEETTGSNLTVFVLNDTMMASEISEVDYANYLSSGLDSFVLSNFDQGDDYLYGEGTYYDNGVQCAVIQSYLTNGTYHYVITWKYPLSYSDVFLDLARRALDYTRIFYVSENLIEDISLGDDLLNDGLDSYETDSVDSSDESASLNSSVFVPQQIETDANYNAQSEAIADAGNSMSSGEVEGNSNNAGQAGSFADAIMSVANISYEQTYYIETIWNTYIGTTPTYAEGYAQTGTDLIVRIVDSNSTNFYIYISLATGDLDGIYANDMNGDLVFLP